MNLLGKSLLSAYRKTETSHIIYDQAPFYKRTDVILGFASIGILVMMFLFKLPEMYLGVPPGDNLRDIKL